MKSVATARIAFQGERGAFSEEAALKLLGDDITLVPCATFDATFSAIRDASRGLRARADGEQPGGLRASLVRSARRERLAHRRRGDYSDRAQFDRRAGSERSSASRRWNRIPWHSRNANNSSSRIRA